MNLSYNNMVITWLVSFIVCSTYQRKTYTEAHSDIIGVEIDILILFMLSVLFMYEDVPST